MTRQSTKQRGITLVEVMLTLAISSLLIVTVLSGRNSIRSQAQFSDGMERVKELVLSTKSEANTGNNTTGTGVGAQYLTIGRTIHFNSVKTAKKAEVLTLLCYINNATDKLCQDRISYTPNLPISNVFPWGITYTGYTGSNGALVPGDVTITFARDDQTGAFTGYWYAGTVVKNTPRTQLFANQTPVALNFKSPDGRTAIITVNPATGTVTRKVL